MLVVGVLPQRQLPETSSQPYLDRTLLTLPSAATLLDHRTSSSDAVLLISVLPFGHIVRLCLRHLPGLLADTSGRRSSRSAARHPNTRPSRRVNLTCPFV